MLRKSLLLSSLFKSQSKHFHAISGLTFSVVYLNFGIRISLPFILQITHGKLFSLGFILSEALTSLPLLNDKPVDWF